MIQILNPNKYYSVSLILLALVILFTIYLIGGIIIVIPFFFLFSFIVSRETLKTIYITETLLVFKGIFFVKRIKLNNIEKIFFVPHSGRGRDYYNIVYKENNRRRKIKLLSYKYDQIYQFIDSLKDFGIEIKKKVHKQKKLVYILSGLYIVIGIFIFYKSMYEFLDYVTQALQSNYHVYNYYFLWLFLAVIIIISISYIVFLFKKKYYNLIFYRAIIFIIVSIFIYFNMINIGISNREAMYNNLLKCNYQLTTYKLEMGRYPEDVNSFLKKNIEFESNLMHGWDMVYIKFKKIASLDIDDIKPGTILIMEYEDKYRLFASFVEKGYLKLIDEKNNEKKQKRKINLYHPGR